MQDLEGFVRHTLIVFFVADQRPAGVRRQKLGRQEMLPRKGTLARPAGADQDDERQPGYRDLHAESNINPNVRGFVIGTLVPPSLSPRLGRSGNRKQSLTILVAI